MPYANEYKFWFVEWHKTNLQPIWMNCNGSPKWIQSKFSYKKNKYVLQFPVKMNHSTILLTMNESFLCVLCVVMTNIWSIYNLEMQLFSFMKNIHSQTHWIQKFIDHTANVCANWIKCANGQLWKSVSEKVKVKIIKKIIRKNELVNFFCNVTLFGCQIQTVFGIISNKPTKIQLNLQFAFQNYIEWNVYGRDWINIMKTQFPH